MANLQVGVAGNGTVTVGSGASVHSPSNNVLTLGSNNDERLRIASDGKVGINDTSPEELLDLGESNQQNLKLGQRGYLGQGYSTGATILGHSVKANTTGTTVGGMEVTESNSGGGAPSAIRMQSGNIEFHTAASGTSGAAFDSERLRINETGGVNITGVCTATAFIPSAGQLGSKNLLHNGGMMVWQRSTSVATVDGTNEGYQSVDGYYNSFVGSANGAYTISKSTEAPDGFNSSIKYDVTTVNSNDSDGNRTIYIWQNIEAQNVVNSGWKPTSTSSYLTFSFYFKTNKSGTNKLAVHLTEHGNAYSYVTDITVSNTSWNRYSVTVPGHASITIPNDNTGGLKVGMAWMVSPGFETSSTDQWVNSREYGTSNSTNWFDNTSNEWYTTGWQVEVGSVATPFEHRSYGDELARCTRYCQVFHAPSNYSYRIVNLQATVHGGGNGVYITGNYRPMRTVPSVSVTGAGLQGNIFTGSWTHSALSSVTNEFVADTTTTAGFSGIIAATSAETSLQPGRTGFLYTATNGQEAALILSAEL